MAQQQLSPQTRAANFATQTRQTYQTLSQQTVKSEGDKIEFLLPKVRLLSKLILEVEATVTLKSANATVPISPFSPYDILRRIELNLNNGFHPYSVSGREAFMYNMMRLNPDVLIPSSTNKRAMAYVENKASAGGTDNKVKFNLELPLTVNQRDPVGLFLLQNPETSVQLNIDTDVIEKAYAKAAGDVVSFKDMKMTVLTETFTIPPDQNAVPDISVLKLVQSKGEMFAGNGQSILRLPIGTVYRKLVLYFEDADGNPLDDSDFAGNLEILFNTADNPISIKPAMLAALNHSQLGYTLPKGCYAFDFSNQGIPNFGGSRDYIDTEKLTDFSVRFSTQKPGKMTAIMETLSRLY